MVNGPVIIDPPPVLFRVERAEPPLRESRMTAEIAALDTVGNRFDIAGAGVLYAASTAEGSLAETSASLRVSASLLQKMERAGATAEELRIPGVDPAWCASRVIRTFETIDALPFIDIEHPDTHTYLTHQARAVLISLGIAHLDVASVRGPSRLLTRGLASWVYQAQNNGTPRFGGIRYVSKLGDYECWAIFDGTGTRVIDEMPLTVDTGDLVAVALRHGIPVIK